MKNYSNGLGLSAIVVLSFCFCRLGAMPGVVDTSSSGMPGVSGTPSSGMPGVPTVPTAPAAPTLDQLNQQVTSDLAKLAGQSSISGNLNILNSILNYVGTQYISPQVQFAYSNAVTSFDTYARRFLPSSISKGQIFQIINFLGKFQGSALFSANVSNYVSSAITFWTNALNNYGLTSSQKAMQRQQRQQR